MIELGLARIGRLLERTNIPWRAIHVAGTNGKGSICAYVSAMLHAAHVRCGDFNSPHLIDRWDCITIDENVVNESLFRQVEARVNRHDAKEGIGASEFELLTATAFHIFTQEKVEVGVVEVGLGGRLDATNVLQSALVTVISKIGQDHQPLLGDTVEEIAYQKAGIMRPGVPCVVDSTNEPSVLEVLETYAGEIGAGPLIKVPEIDSGDCRLRDFFQRSNLEPHQQVNLQCAFEATRQALKQLRLDLDPVDLLQATKNTSWRGRLQKESIRSLTGRNEKILIDGAHNAQSVRVLGSIVDRTLRESNQSITWVLAASKGKDLEELLLPLVRAGDSVVTVEFGPVDGMPWVAPASSKDLLEIARRSVKLTGQHDAGPDVLGALRWSSEVAGGGPLVVAGSLYLVSDVLRLLRDVERGVQ
ncbi:MAG: folylpolyglutamate synthase [Pleopsidium flavum]|nr:MAG: folylpolyglutamate synthase [Pleopsidium flavum]KAI9876427.1 MAG: folylpolyglutamate synthase [Pleopsidium flavum]